MKMTKSLMISAVILAGILFTGCPGGAGGNGGTSGKTKDVIKIIDGKSAEVNYTNNTNETQKFRVYVNSLFPEKAEGRFYLYDQPTNSPYEFGVFLDYRRGIDSNIEWNDFNLIKLNVENKQDGYTPTKFYLGRFCGDILAEPFDNYFEGLDFTKVTDYTEFSRVIDSDNGKDYDDSYKFTFEARSDGKRLIRYSTSFLYGDYRSSNAKYGYYLILPPGSTCHLKFIITETN
ncbi:MAG: hypothetical protein K6E97_08225 [Treponema sp.]|nr:hypothetical protein [Treponema sp.]